MDVQIYAEVGIRRDLVWVYVSDVYFSLVCREACRKDGMECRCRQGFCVAEPLALALWETGIPSCRYLNPQSRL
jgi:hypothetical protein